MRWPWQKRTERRESGGDFSDAVVRLIEAQAAGTADASSTAAVEAAAGLLSRAFQGAEVDGPGWVQDAVNPAVLGQIGRDLIRKGSSLHAIRMAGGTMKLIPCSSWHWEGSHDPEAQSVRATAYGPSTSTTWNLPARSVVYARWGSNPGQPYVGVAPTHWASVTAKLSAESERSLADEAAGPIAQLLAVPQDGGDGGDDDPLAALKDDIGKARGKALLVESTADAWGEGQQAAPRKDWGSSRLGPEPPQGMVQVADAAFGRVLAACGMSPALFDDSDGTAKREALRQWFMGTVMPLARLLDWELSRKLESPVRLRFDSYPLDLAGRAQSFQKLVAGGVAVTEALAISGLLAGEE